MQRVITEPRSYWKEKAAEYGFDFYQTIYDTDCWNEDAYYKFSLEQVEEIEAATKELHMLCLGLVHDIASSNNDNLLRALDIPEALIPIIKRLVKQDPKHLYGRFDFAYDGINPPKMLEYNADTPTALYESAVWQWYWVEELKQSGRLNEDVDQFNSLHEKLRDRWSSLIPKDKIIYFTCMGEFPEDIGTVRYLEDTARQAGYATNFVSLEDIGMMTYDTSPPSYVMLDKQGKSIDYMFKLYPWEWLLKDSFGKAIPYLSTKWIEPAWKLMLSNKGILPLLWQRYPGHRNLLPAYFDGDPKVSNLGTSFVRKPFFSREGSNVSLVKDNKLIQEIPGAYGGGNFIRQKVADIPCFDGKHAIIGSWVVGDEPAGMIVRESDEFITNNWSQLVPHIIEG